MWWPRLHAYRVPTDVMNIVEDADPEWQEELKRCRALWIVSRVQGSQPTACGAETPEGPQKGPPATKVMVSEAWRQVSQNG